MNEAAKLLFNHTDFQSFFEGEYWCKHIRLYIYEAYWKQEEDEKFYHFGQSFFKKHGAIHSRNAN
jgi:hypothetical protein